MRILLAPGTGLRRGDIESLRISDIDFANNYITMTSRKTKKNMPAFFAIYSVRYCIGFQD